MQIVEHLVSVENHLMLLEMEILERLEETKEIVKSFIIHANN